MLLELLVLVCCAAMLLLAWRIDATLERRIGAVLRIGAEVERSLGILTEQAREAGRLYTETLSQAERARLLEVHRVQTALAGELLARLQRLDSEAATARMTT